MASLNKEASMYRRISVHLDHGFDCKRRIEAALVEAAQSFLTYDHDRKVLRTVYGA